jgi:hypothetical protein
VTIRIAMWSGPRNISTAMMRSFGNRPDTAVVDEPFYAAYLHETGLDHPLRDAVLTSQPTDREAVILALISASPCSTAWMVCTDRASVSLPWGSPTISLRIPLIAALEVVSISCGCIAFV